VIRCRAWLGSRRYGNLSRRAFLSFALMAVVLAPSLCSAADYSCGQITVEASIVEGRGEAHAAIAKSARLDLHVDLERPELSMLRWTGTGNPAMDGKSSPWPADARIALVDGAPTADMSANRDGATSVASVFLSPEGGLIITEDTTVAAAHALLHHVVRGRCAIGPGMEGHPLN
jgi:hypothetical protein